MMRSLLLLLLLSTTAGAQSFCDDLKKIMAARSSAFHGITSAGFEKESGITHYASTIQLSDFNKSYFSMETKDKPVFYAEITGLSSKEAAEKAEADLLARLEPCLKDFKAYKQEGSFSTLYYVSNDPNAITAQILIGWRQPDLSQNSYNVYLKIEQDDISMPNGMEIAADFSTPPPSTDLPAPTPPPPAAPMTDFGKELMAICEAKANQFADIMGDSVEGKRHSYESSLTIANADAEIRELPSGKLFVAIMSDGLSKEDAEDEMKDINQQIITGSGGLIRANAPARDPNGRSVYTYIDAANGATIKMSTLVSRDDRDEFDVILTIK